MSEKKYATTITDMPKPPRTQPTRARASSTIAWLMPQRSIRLPANTNAGIASSAQRCARAAALRKIAGKREARDREQPPALRARPKRGEKRLHRIAADQQPGD